MNPARPGRYTRRQLLATLSAAGISGCASERPSADSTPPPTTEPSTRTSKGSPTSQREGADADVHVMTDATLLNKGWSEKWEQEIVPVFQARFDATVSVDGISGERSRIIQRLLDARDPPELYYGTIRETARHIARDQTIPVDDLVRDLQAVNGTLVGEQFITSRGTTHLVPHGLVVGGVLNYRTDIYDELGLSVPQTWAQLLDNARAIDESERFDARGFDVAPAASYFTPWLYTAGGGYWRWRGEDRVELDFQTEHVRDALGMLKDLVPFSRRPSESSYGEMFSAWADGRLGQCLFPNARLAQLAYENADPDNEYIGLETAQAPAPLVDTTLDPPTRGGGFVQGTPLFEGANVELARQFLRFMYEGPSRQADKNNLKTQYLPPYEGIIQTDEYASSAIYRAENGHFLELEKQFIENVLPHYLGERPRTVPAWYAMQPNSVDDAPIEEMVRSVLVDGVSMDDAIVRARRRLQDQLEEGRQLQSS